MKRWEIYLEIFMEILIFGAIVLFIGLGLPKLVAFFWPIVAAAILAMITNPLKRFLEKYLKMPKKLGATLMVILLLAVVSFAIYGLVKVVILGAGKVSQMLPGIYDDLMTSLDDVVNRVTLFFHSVNPDIAESIQKTYTTLGEEIAGFIANIGSRHVGALGGIATSLTNLVVGVIVMFMSAYFILIYYDNIRYFFYNIEDEKLRERLHQISHHVLGSLGHYILAQIKLMLIISVILFIGLLILGRSYPLLLAVLIAILDAVPFFGTGTVLCPWAAVTLIRGDVFLAIGLFVLYIICLLSRQILQPKVIGETIGMNPFVTLILMFIGTKVAGLIGFMVSVLLGIIVYRLYEIGMFDGMLKRMKRRLELLREVD